MIEYRTRSVTFAAAAWHHRLFLRDGQYVKETPYHSHKDMHTFMAALTPACISAHGTSDACLCVSPWIIDAGCVCTHFCILSSLTRSPKPQPKSNPRKMNATAQKQKCVFVGENKTTQLDRSSAECCLRCTKAEHQLPVRRNLRSLCRVRCSRRKRSAPQIPPWLPGKALALQPGIASRWTGRNASQC
jgi:hypothetical protein